MAFNFGVAAAPAAQGTSFNFGSPAAAAPAAQTSGASFNFGSPAAAAPAAQTPGASFNFGSPGAAAPAAQTPGTSFSFGTPAAAAPAAQTPGTSFSFGSPAAAPAAGAGFGFPRPAAGAQPAAAAPAAAPFTKLDEDYAKKVETLSKLKLAWTGPKIKTRTAAGTETEVENPDGQFQALVFKESRKAGSGATPFPARFKGVSEELWRDAERKLVTHDLCEDLVPMKATGAEQLAKRAETQKKKIAELEQTLAMAEKDVRRATDSGSGASERARKLQAKADAQVARLADLTSRLHVLTHLGCPLSEDERRHYLALQQLADRVAHAGRSAQDLFNAEDLRTGHGRFGATAGSNQLSRSSTHSSSGSGVGMEKQETVAIRSALDVQRTALDRLSDVLKRDMRDLGIVKREAGLRIGN